MCVCHRCPSELLHSFHLTGLLQGLSCTSDLGTLALTQVALSDSLVYMDRSEGKDKSALYRGRPPNHSDTFLADQIDTVILHQLTCMSLGSWSG